MDSKMADAYDSLPTNKLIELQFCQSRQRSAKRHNRHVLHAARRRARRERVKRFFFDYVIPAAGIISVFLPVWIWVVNG